MARGQARLRLEMSAKGKALADRGDGAMADAPSPVMFAVVTSKRDAVSGGMAPIFYAKDDEERDRIAMWIVRITNANVHDLHNGCLILVTSSAASVGSGG